MKPFARLLLAAAVIGLWVAGWGTARAVPISADVISIVDESGSMAGEHAWLGPMISGANGLESGLLGQGVGTGAQANRYGLVGFGTRLHGGGASQVPHKHTVGSGDFGTASQYSTATGGLTISGGLEDGWRGIAFALNNYSFNTDAARNLILVTDEDRDNTDASLSYSGMQGLIKKYGALLNAVVNATLRCADGSTALGIAAGGTGYKADGSGGFTTCGGATATGGSGSTVSDYVDLALSTGGAAWDLNQLRAGGTTADSFTAAFVNIKVQEIIHPTPEPGILALMSIGLLGIGIGKARARRRSA